ncbi:MAG: GNAT family N-acetyltransferase [Lachnospiraceae bacterium]|nr:GNAT family N-acetyltransferase [Lachnospiraceae bacterium]
MEQGRRIYLRPIEVADAEMFVKWRNREWVRRNFIYQNPFTVESQIHWIRTQVEPGHVVQFIICTKQGDRPIGSVYFRDIDRGEGTAEYGIFIGERDAVGCGYGTEAACMALEYAFTKLHLRKIFLRFLEDNVGARKSYEHAGFRLTDRTETVTTLSGERKARFMEIDYGIWEALNAAGGAD